MADEGYEKGVVTKEIEFQIASIYKGLSDQYVRVVELIVQKSSKIDLNTLKYWREIGKINSDWEEGHFINLINYKTLES